MSGLEVLAVIGLISQCWEPLKDTLGLMREIYTKANEFNDEYEGVPVQFRELQTVLATLKLVLERVKEKSETETIHPDNQAGLSDILRNCRSSMQELGDLFKKHYLPEQDTTFANLRRAIHILADKPEIVKIQCQVDRYIQAITAYSSAFAPTAQEISNAITTDLEKIIDRKYGRLERLLKQRQQISPPLGAEQNDKASSVSSSAICSPKIYRVQTDLSNSSSEKAVSVLEAYMSSPQSSTRDIFETTDSSDAHSPASETSSVYEDNKPEASRTERNVQALDKVNSLIIQGSEAIPNSSVSAAMINSANTKARRVFLEAMYTLSLVTEQDHFIAIRKYRGLTHASLCLTRVTKAEERDEHLFNAAMYNLEADAAVQSYCESPETNPDEARIVKGQIALDRATVYIRQARIANKASTSKRRLSAAEDSKLNVSLALEAFQVYDDLAKQYTDTCVSCADYDIRAQALLGCGEAVQMLEGLYGTWAVARLGYHKPQHYFDLATHSAIKGSQVSNTPSDTSNSIRRSLTRAMRLKANNLEQSRVSHGDAIRQNTST